MGKTYGAVVFKTMSISFDFDESELEGGTPHEAAYELAMSFPDREWEEDDYDLIVTEVGEIL